MAVEDLKQSPMIYHMLEALDRGEDIGHYGRLTFAMVARHFVDNDELVELLTKDHDAEEQEIRAMVQQIEEKGYSPPRREKILQWQQDQEFQICPNPDDPNACNIYNELPRRGLRGHTGVPERKINLGHLAPRHTESSQYA
jgi:DNA primase large subunit